MSHDFEKRIYNPIYQQAWESLYGIDNFQKSKRCQTQTDEARVLETKPKPNTLKCDILDGGLARACPLLL